MSKDIKEIADLTPDVRNANKGTQRGLSMLEDSLRNYGAGRSILVDKDGEVIAGNKTLEVAADLGLPVRVVKTNGSELVVVQREDLDLDDGDKARQLAYADNRTVDVGLDWDAQRILEDMQDGVDLGTFFTDSELDKLVATVLEPQTPGGGELDISAELYERHDYLVFYFENEFDWQVACQAFGVQQVQSAQVYKRTIEHRGVGRVFPAKKLLQFIGHE